MNFKDWLLQENPEEPTVNHVSNKHYIGDKQIKNPQPRWKDSDALSFGLLKNFYLYADSSMGIYHSHILEHLWSMIKQPNSYLLNDDVLTYGELNYFALKQIEDWLASVDKNVSNRSDRPAAIWTAPDFLLGRVWTDQKIISFWNKTENVYNHQDDVLKFISLFGNPKDYMFEVEDEWKDYGDFVKKKKGKFKDFDPTKIHVLDPSIKGQVMKAFGRISYAPKGPGIKTWQKAFTSETTLYHGTRGKFNDLKPHKARLGTGISFTTNPDIAFNYALGRYKGGRTVGEPVIKKLEYSGKSFNFFEKVPNEIVVKIEKQLIPYLEEFTPDKKRIFLKNLYGSWTVNGKTFYTEIQRSFAKKGTTEECKLAKSKNKNLEVCSKCSVFEKMPDLLNRIFANIGFDSFCYDDINDGIPHRCYFLIKQDEEQ